MDSLATEIGSKLDECGYVILRDYPLDFSSVEESSRAFSSIADALGTPVAHDAGGAIVWDIKSRPTSDSSVITYSEHSHEAELHTDCQYSDDPEDCFGMLCLKKADCGGGESLLLSLADIESELAATDDGRRCSHILRTLEFPFIVPSVFKKTKSPEPEFVTGLVLQDNRIRFRVDTIEKALKQWPEFDTPERRFAFEYLCQIVSRSEKINRFHIEAGEMLFINNLTMLHGRSAFTDETRHLTRIRLRRFPVKG